MDTASNVVSTMPTAQNEYFSLLLSEYESNNMVSVIL
jgi:hypothetical protein